jgi:hypothetical protein
VYHTQWQQLLDPGGGRAVLSITWDFAAGKTLAQRFQDAVTRGETVYWTVSHGGSSRVLTGTWWFSSQAGGMLDRFESAGSNFSSDDGLWGASTSSSTSTVNGNVGVPASFWGHGNAALDDTLCARMYLGSTAYNVHTALVNRMYVLAVPAPPPPPPPPPHPPPPRPPPPPPPPPPPSPPPPSPPPSPPPPRPPPPSQNGIRPEYWLNPATSYSRTYAAYLQSDRAYNDVVFSSGGSVFVSGDADRFSSVGPRLSWQMGVDTYVQVIINKDDESDVNHYVVFSTSPSQTKENWITSNSGFSRTQVVFALTGTTKYVHSYCSSCCSSGYYYSYCSASTTRACSQRGESVWTLRLTSTTAWFIDSNCGTLTRAHSLGEGPYYLFFGADTSPGQTAVFHQLKPLYPNGTYPRRPSGIVPQLLCTVRLHHLPHPHRHARGGCSDVRGDLGHVHG